MVPRSATTTWRHSARSGGTGRKHLSRHHRARHPLARGRHRSVHGPVGTVPPATGSAPGRSPARSCPSGAHAARPSHRPVRHCCTDRHPRPVRNRITAQRSRNLGGFRLSFPDQGGASGAARRCVRSAASARAGLRPQARPRAARGRCCCNAGWPVNEITPGRTVAQRCRCADRCAQLRGGHLSGRSAG